MRRHCSTVCAASLSEEERETQADTLSDAQALVETLADSLPEVDVDTLAETLSNAHALVESLAYTVADLAP